MIGSYLNMLLQALFQVKEFVVEVMRYREPKDFAQVLASMTLRPETEERRKVISIISWVI